MKQTLLLAALALTTVTATAQRYTLRGTVPADWKRVVVVNHETRAADTLTVTAGTFTLSGDAAGHRYAEILKADAQSGDASAMVILDGNVTADLTRNVTGGTAENDSLNAYVQLIDAAENAFKPLNDEAMALRKEGKEIPAEMMAKLEAAYEKYQELTGNLLRQSFRTGHDMYFPAVLLRAMRYSVEKEEIVAMAETAPRFMETDLMKGIRASLEGWKRQAVGTMFTDLVMADTAGQKAALSDYVGKGSYVLIDFWASWCGPCRQEMPAVKALYDKYHADGFDIVGVSFDQQGAAWKAAIRKLGLTWHHISDLKGWQCAAASVYGVNSIPATLLVGPDGKIIASGLRAEGLAEKLAEIFKK